MNAQLKPSRESIGPYIGGSNVAGILGVSPYRTQLDEYFQIVDGRPDDTPEREAFFARRKALEPWAFDLFRLKTGRTIVRTNVRYTDPQFEFMKAEIDFETDDGCNGETKTVHPLAAKAWGDAANDDIPVYVTAQAMHGLMVKPAPAAYVHALIGFDDDRVYRIERDDVTIAAMRERELEFWRRVQDRNAPPAVNGADVMRLFARDHGTVIEATDEIALAFTELSLMKKRAKEDEKSIEALADQIKVYMGPHANLMVDGKIALTWKTQDSLRLDQKALEAAHPDLFAQFKAVSTTRVFRLK